MSISVVVNDLDWTQPHHTGSGRQSPAGSVSVLQRTLFVSLRRVLKLFKSQSRSMLLQRAFYTWHNLLRMRERRRWVTCFCQKMYGNSLRVLRRVHPRSLCVSRDIVLMCRRLLLQCAFCLWKCATILERVCDDANHAQKSAVRLPPPPPPRAAANAVQVSLPSISLSVLEELDGDSPDYQRVMSGFRQQLHVQTLQEKLQSDNRQLDAAIRVLKQQVDVTQRAAVDEQFPTGDEEDRAQCHRSLVTVLSLLFCRRVFAPFVTRL